MFVAVIQESLALPFPPEDVENYADLIFEVEGHHFKCHKVSLTSRHLTGLYSIYVSKSDFHGFQVFFSLRSDYFKALLENHFGENTVVKSTN